MNEIQVSAASTTKDEEAFKKEVSKSLSRVANLAGWEKEYRERVLYSVDKHPAVLKAWECLQREASFSDSIAIWEWNRHVRLAVDHMLVLFYDGEWN